MEIGSKHFRDLFKEQKQKKKEEEFNSKPENIVNLWHINFIHLLINDKKKWEEKQKEIRDAILQGLDKPEYSLIKYTLSSVNDQYQLPNKLTYDDVWNVITEKNFPSLVWHFEGSTISNNSYKNVDD